MSINVYFIIHYTLPMSINVYFIIHYALPMSINVYFIICVASTNVKYNFYITYKNVLLSK